MNQDEWYERCVFSLSLSVFFTPSASSRERAKEASSSRIRFRVAFVVERVYVCVFTCTFYIAFVSSGK